PQQNPPPEATTGTTSVRRAKTAGQANAASKRQCLDQLPSRDTTDRGPRASETPLCGQTEGRGAEYGHGEMVPPPCPPGGARRKGPKERRRATSKTRPATRRTRRSQTIARCR